MKFTGNILRFLYHFIILFCFMTELPIVGPLTTRRFAVAVALATIVANHSKIKRLLPDLVDKKKLINSFFLLFFCAAITVIHHISIVINPNNIYIEYWYYFYIILYIFVFSIYCLIEFKTLKDLAMVWMAIMVVEAVAIYFAAISTPARMMLYETFYYGDDRFEKSIEWGTRIVGIGIHSSTGSITMSATIIFMTYLRIKEKISMPLYMFSAFILVSSTMFIGRTGVLVELFIIAFYFIFYGVSVKKILYIVLSGLLLFSFVIYLLRSSDSSNSETLIKWMLEALDSEKRQDIYEGIGKGGFPPFTPEFFFGTGLATGYSANGVIYSADSGFIRIWMSIGLVGFIMFYYAMLLLLRTPKFSKCSKKLRRYLYYVILIAFVIETKEPFMMKYIFPWAIMTISLFMAKESREEHVLRIKVNSRL